MIRISKYLIPYVVILLLVGFKGQIADGFIIIFIHELIHLITARIRGYSGFTIDILPVGTALKLKDLEEATAKDDIIISLSGPLGNFIMAMVLYIISKFYGIPGCDRVISYNIIIGVFNLIPAYPLDGGRILRDILTYKFIFKKAHKIALNISIVIGILFGGIFFAGIFFGSFNINIAAIALFIIVVSWRERRRVAYIIMGYMVKKKEKLVKRGYLENKSISVHYGLSMLRLIELVDKNKYNEFIVLDDDMNVLDILYEEDILCVLKEQGNITLKDLVSHNSYPKE